MVFEVGIGTSQNWNPTEAGKEVVTQAMSTLIQPPKFILLFSTIHYEKDNGFQKILDTIYTFVSKETPLVGGTVTGFMNNHGVYTRGLTLLACYSDEMDVAVGLGTNTKKNPEKAAQECAKTIKERIQNSKYVNKFLFENTSNGIIPSMPFMGQKRIIKIPFASKLFVQLLKIINTTFQYGVGRDDEVLNWLSKSMPDYKIQAIANYDDNKSVSNYQFYNSSYCKNSISTLAINTNASININISLGLKPTNTTFNISDLGLFGCTFGKINNKPASKEILKILGWPEEYLNERIYRRTYYYPVGYSDEETSYPHTMGLFLGDHICCTYGFKEKELKVFDVSGSRLLESIEKDLIFNIKGKDVHFVLGSACTSILETLSSKIYLIREEFVKVLNNHPYLVVFGAGEGTYSPGKKSKYFNHSFIITTIYKDNLANNNSANAQENQ
ncbi:MAG: FIST N-terminal domain-containing protein [Candidatus Micrarchaeota archaeon]